MNPGGTVGVDEMLRVCRSLLNSWEPGPGPVPADEPAVANGAPEPVRRAASALWNNYFDPPLAERLPKQLTLDELKAARAALDSRILDASPLAANAEFAVWRKAVAADPAALGPMSDWLEENGDLSTAEALRRI
jgi:hypothetical protein